jgi:2-desacetyl-2-hydroxyethyl bacteriochlorophyllide A dehydrogenase
VTLQPEGRVAIEEVPRPAPAEPTDALVRVTLAAICGSDLHIVEGLTPVEEGAVLGHEFVGVVEEVGPGVTRFRPGDRVVACFYASCGSCAQCRRGWFAQCPDKRTFGHGEYFGGLGGGQADYCVVPFADHTLEHVPDGVGDEPAVLVGDALATALFGAERAEVRPGDSVAVVGAGPVGLLSVLAVQLFGPATVFAVDTVPDRLRLAEELGAAPVDASARHPVEAIQSATGGLGAHASIECVGAMAAVETAIDCVRGGGTISMVGVPSEVTADFPYVQAWMRDLTFRAGWCNVQPYLRPLLELLRAGRLRPERVISHRMALDEGEEAYRIFRAREATKIVLRP